jgi:hypothetical protein
MKLKKVRDGRPTEPKWLIDLPLASVEALADVPCPIPELLEHSLFYPASGCDGRPVHRFAGLVYSFVYVDYGITRTELLTEVAEHGFTGYRLAGSKSLPEHELAPCAWRVEIPPRFTGDAEWFEDVRVDIGEAFAEWMVFERTPDRDSSHGPERFSLLHICADGVAAYREPYRARGIAPLMLSVIQSGHGFGGNYTDFADSRGLLATMVLSSEAKAVPEFLVCGGSDFDARRAYWPARYPHLVKRFHGEFGLGVWRHCDGNEARRA